MFKRITCRTLRVSVVIHVHPVAHGGVVAAPQQRPHHSGPVPAEGNDSLKIVKSFTKFRWQLYIPVVAPLAGERVDALHVEHHSVVQVGSLGPQHRALQCKQIFYSMQSNIFWGKLEYFLANLQEGGGQQVRERGLLHVVLHLPAAAREIQRTNKCYLVRTW